MAPEQKTPRQKLAASLVAPTLTQAMQPRMMTAGKVNAGSAGGGIGEGLESMMDNFAQMQKKPDQSQAMNLLNLLGIRR